MEDRLVPPRVSVVIPMRNEGQHIARCVQSILENDYPQDRMEVLVVDGKSDDHSREIVQAVAGQRPEVGLLSNPQQITPVAMNLGIRASRGEVIIILGAHGYVAPDFLRQAVTCLCRHPDASCVGGIRHNIAEGFWGRAIAYAMQSAFGIGNARYLTGGPPGYVDTVWAGAYRREVFDQIGFFDELFVRNQDDELNYRLTRSGRRIYFDPRIQSYYHVRSSLSQLWKQYFQYGYWKIGILAKHSLLPSWRHIVPGSFVLALTASMVLATVTSIGRVVLGALGGTYLLATLVSGVPMVKEGGVRFALGLPIVFAAIHLSYGLGFLNGLWDLVISPRGTHRGKHTELTR